MSFASFTTRTSSRLQRALDNAHDSFERRVRGRGDHPLTVISQSPEEVIFENPAWLTLSPMQMRENQGSAGRSRDFDLGYQSTNTVNTIGSEVTLTNNGVINNENEDGFFLSEAHAESANTLVPDRNPHWDAEDLRISLSAIRRRSRLQGQEREPKTIESDMIDHLQSHIHADPSIDGHSIIKLDQSMFTAVEPWPSTENPLVINGTHLNDMELEEFKRIISTNIDDTGRNETWAITQVKCDSKGWNVSGRHPPGGTWMSMSVVPAQWTLHPVD